MWDNIYGPYEETPWYHPWRWIFGCGLRRWVNAGPWHGSWWEYARPRTLAHELLRRQYGGKQ